MAVPSHHASLDVPVTLKVFYDGATRRFKMPLREMVPRILEKHIPNDSQIMIERYSDSATAYVLLDATNASVYKQLYRAAKAKSKLRLRVSLIGKYEDTVSPPTSVAEEVSSCKAAARAVIEHVPAVKNDVETSASIAKSKTSTPSIRPSVDSPNAKLVLLNHVSHANPTITGVENIPETQSQTGELSGEHQCCQNNARQPTNDLADLACRLQWQLPATTTRQRPSRYDEASMPSDAAQSNESTVSESASPFPAKDNRPAVSKKPVPSSTSESNDTARSKKTAFTYPATGCNYAVSCNNCESNIPNAHYHCSICDDGDFDLCQSCVDMGFTCHSNDHWLIKRSMKNGQLVNSITETIALKPKSNALDNVQALDTAQEKAQPNSADANAQKFLSRAFEKSLVSRPDRWACLSNMRTCNCCIQELPEREFLHCRVCEDFDLCQSCFASDGHGHHPKHDFVPAVSGAPMPDYIKTRMRPGRNQMHHAICDGCDKYIMGVRHKCLSCPDWDFCPECILNAHLLHANHRFVPIYEPLAIVQACPTPQAIHLGICCDGPLCSASQAFPSYIRGIRYKCAVCHDLDFCANCEAHPGNNHNKTHPLIKFKTPVRHVSVTTTGERQDGERMPAMGDRTKSPEPASSSEGNTLNAVQTVVEVKPQVHLSFASDEPIAKEPEHEVEPNTELNQASAVTSSSSTPAAENALRAVFVRDTVHDGTILPPNQVFEQTWVLRNEGNVAWPAGCSVKFVGGDYMGHIDPAHPAGVSELVSASESTICDIPLAPGDDFSFTVTLRTPARPGRVIYWRLTTRDGFKFGHRLWCEVSVRSAAEEARPQLDVIHIEDVKEEQEKSSGSSSAMIFPKLEKESPGASMHEEAQFQASVPANAVDAEYGFENCGDDDEWDASEADFLTDEEYDILDASDEEFLEQRQQKPAKK